MGPIVTEYSWDNGMIIGKKNLRRHSIWERKSSNLEDSPAMFDTRYEYEIDDVFGRNRL